MGYPGRVGSSWPKKKSSRVTSQPVFSSNKKNRVRVRYFSSQVRSGQKILTRFAMSTCVRIILLAHAGLIMCTQACTCVCINLPKNPNFYFVCFITTFTYSFCLASFPIFLCFHFLCFTCLFACLLSHVELGFILCFPCFNAMIIHSHVHKWCHRWWVVAR